MQSVGNSLLEIDVTPTVTAAAYSAGNQVGGIQTLSKPCFDQNRFTKLCALAITDNANQKAAFNIFLFNQLPTVSSTDKTAVDIASSELASKCVGVITIATSDYQTCKAATNAVGLKTFSELFWQSQDTQARLYAVVVTTGTPTYASTSDLVFKWIFMREF
jgi:hypothetical protein